jgi:AraC family transcriptional regulator of arabinose operon
MDKRIRATVAVMEERLHARLSPEVLARAVNLSASRFRHLFKAETGASPVQYLNLLRIRRARVLVETTFLSMKQIRSRVGVNDKKHFINGFRKLYGLTPAEYRARHHRQSFQTSSPAPVEIAVTTTR